MASDRGGRAQALPFIMRKIFSYLYATSSLTTMLRQEDPKMEVVCLECKQDLVRGLWIRDVKILSRHRVQWYARSIICSKNCSGPIWRHSGSLGDFLFSSPKIYRKELSIGVVLSLPFAADSERSWYWQRKSIWLLPHPLIRFEILEFF
jgi:chorismate-pyruvate lyase